MIIATSQLFPNDLDFDLRIQLRCIKNTEYKGPLSKEEKVAYENYAKKIREFYSREVDGSLYLFWEIREIAFDYFPFELSHPSTKKVFKQKITDFKNIINFLCDPILGSFRRVPNDQRSNQQLICYSSRENIWKINQPRKTTLSQQAKYHNDCEYLLLKNANFNKLELQNVDFDSIISVQFINVEMFTHQMELHPFLRNVHFKNLVNLELVSCKIQKLPDVFFYLIPRIVKHLCLINNDITHISEKISRLRDLRELNLRGNRNLGDSGIPWNFLPCNLVILVLRQTNITKIPEEIRYLHTLNVLRVSSPQLKHISWENISYFIDEIVVEAGNELNDLNLSENCSILHELHICNAGIKQQNKFQRPNYSLLQKLYSNISTDVFGELPFIALNFANNNIKMIEWELSPSNLQYICFDQNHLTSTENISHLTDLTYFSAVSNQLIAISDDLCKLENLSYLNLSNNQLDRLPLSFENLNNLNYLNLSKNKFTYQSENFNEFLWSRLPPNLNTLILNENMLHKLPCSLRNFNILLLSADDCRLSHVCPYLYTYKKLQNLHWRLKIQQNSIEFLPFIPQKIFQDSPLNTKPSTEYTDSTGFVLTSNKEEFIYGKVFPKKLKKPIYDFKLCDGDNECRCCANCGEQTNENMVQQIMVMDFQLELKNVLKISKKNKNSKVKYNSVSANAETMENNSDVAVDSENILEDNQNSQEFHYRDSKPKYYEPGQWKTIVKTRLCAKCLKDIRMKTDEAYEEFKNCAPDNLIKAKKNKMEVKNSDVKDENIHYHTIGDKNIVESSNASARKFFQNVSEKESSIHFNNNNTLLSTYANVIQSKVADVYQSAIDNYQPKNSAQYYIEESSTVLSNKNNTMQQQQNIIEIANPPLPPSSDILLLLNPYGVDCFLNAAVNIIDSMKEVKNSVCRNAKFYVVKPQQLELAKVLLRQTNNVRSLRQTLPLYLDNKQEDAAVALFTLMLNLDYQSQALFCYSYDTVRSCKCKSEARTATQCSTLHLTIGHESNNVTTFDSMLLNWTKYQSGQCSICGFSIFKEHFVKFGSAQQFLIVEINTLINVNNGMQYRSISLANFNEECQSIFGVFWQLIAAVQYTGNVDQGHYLTWRKSENGWNVISDDKYWQNSKIIQDLKHYRILVFKKIHESPQEPLKITQEQQSSSVYHNAVNEPHYFTYTDRNKQNQYLQQQNAYFEYPVLQQPESIYCQANYNENFENYNFSNELTYHSILTNEKERYPDETHKYQQSEALRHAPYHSTNPISQGYQADNKLQNLDTQEIQQQMTVLNVNMQQQNNVEANQETSNDFLNIDFEDWNSYDWDSFDQELKQ